jgi:hypothetical protein
MRFIIGFFFFGFLFYLIYIFFPEAFQILVSWAAAVYDFFRDLFHSIVEKTQGSNNKSVKPETSQTVVLSLLNFLR